MPPKKKVDPEVLQQQFEAWKETEEYKKWEEMSEGLKKFYPVTETTLDINGPWQDYFDELMKFFAVMKAKTGKIKEIKHETVRSFFFAREDKETEKIIIDGIPCGVVKEHADRAWTLRHKFCDIFKAFSDIEDLDYENFQTQKKNLQKTIQEFFKYYTPHVKSGHKDIYETKIFKVLEPLSNLIEINALHYTFNRKYKKDTEKEIRSFKVKALCEKYCVYFAEVLRVLDEQSKDYKLISRIDLKKVFYKLSYKGWATNPCEKLYIEPLQNNFTAMQKVLMEMYAYGINYWKVPLAQNEEFLAEMENLIKAEIISDRLLGTPLRRELFNFVYKVAGIIKAASPFLEQNMLKKDENTVAGSIPKLVIFKQVQHMFSWKAAKIEFEKSEDDRSTRLSLISRIKEEHKLNLSMISEKQEAGTSQNSPRNNESSILNDSLRENPNGHTSTHSKALKEMASTLPVKIPLSQNSNKQEIFNFSDELEQKIDDPVLEFDRMHFGRYDFLEGYIHPEKVELFEKAVDMIKHINPAVQQDIEDSIILHGITPKVTNRHDQSRVQARLELEKLQEHDFSNQAVNAIRPPELWNYPEAIGKHTFRSIAKPKESYIDGRFEEFDEIIESLAQSLISFKPESWREIVSRTIDVFSETYNRNITPINPNETF